MGLTYLLLCQTIGTNKCIENNMRFPYVFIHAFIVFFAGHYMYFTSNSRDTGTLTSPLSLTTPGGCVKFFYNIEGGVSAELRVYVVRNGVRSFVFYENGIGIETDEWREGSFDLPAGETHIEFVAYGDIFFMRPSIIAIDDVLFTEEICPQRSK